jgi:hypothetical protein
MLSRLKWRWVGVAVCLVLAAFPGRGLSAERAPDKEAAKKYLDGRMKEWLRWPGADRGQGTRCISCHTAVPLALARFSLGGVSDPEKEMMASVRARVGKWDRIASWDRGADKIRPFYGGERKGAALATEAVLNALVLVSHDVKRNEGKLSDDARKALDSMWSTQNGRGSWDWLDFGLRPWELKAEYYGAALAAVAVGSAGRGYPETGLTPEGKKKLGKLRDYLKADYRKESLHNRLAALWAATLLPGILTPGQQKELIDEVLALDRAGDAWGIVPLVKRPEDRKPPEPANAIPADARYDGYATAFTVHVLKRARVGSEAGKLAKARAWLVRHKVAEGKGPVIYLNSRRNPDSSKAHDAMVGKFMRDAAAGYAVLALHEPD